MKNLTEIIEKYSIKKITLIVFMVLICTFFFGTHSFQILSDRGREFLLTQGILEGNVPFKDILFLYSPLAYYINAIFMFIFGKTVSTLIFASVLCCIIFASIYFHLAKRFMSESLSFATTLLVVLGCMTSCSLFGYILPYSYSMTYALTATLIAVYTMVLFFEKKDTKTLYISNLFAGFSFALKFEFLPILLICAGFTLFQNELNPKKKISALLLTVLMPIMTFLIPLIQGASLNDIKEFISFFTDFSKTESMNYFLKDVGTIFKPSALPLYINGIMGFLITLFLSVLANILHNKLRKKFIFPIFFALIFLIMFIFTEPYNQTALLPLIVLSLFIIKFKDVKSNPCELIIILASICTSIRTLALMRMNMYGTYTLPLLIISLYILLNKFTFDGKVFKSVEIKSLFKFMTWLYLVFFAVMNIISCNYCNTKLISEKGDIFLPKEQAVVLNEAINFIKTETADNEKVLVLPEGQIINFLTDRRCDLKLHMLDRLYYEGLGEEKALQLLKNSDNDTIVIAKGFNLSNFGKIDLYEENNAITKYLSENYRLTKTFGEENHKLFILNKQR